MNTGEAGDGGRTRDLWLGNPAGGLWGWSITAVLRGVHATARSVSGVLPRPDASSVCCAKRGARPRYGRRRLTVGRITTSTVWMPGVVYWAVSSAAIGDTRCLDLGPLSIIAGPTGAVRVATHGRVLVFTEDRGLARAICWARR